MTDWFARGCIEEATFLEEIDLLRATYPQIDEVHRSITIILSTNPRSGERLKYSDTFWLFVTTPVAETPSFWVLYRYDTEFVYLVSIKPASEDV